MKNIKMPCEVVNGAIQVNRIALDRQVKALNDGLYTLTIEPVTDNISHQQRKYFFGVVISDLQSGFANKGIAVSVQELRTLLETLFMFREEYNPVLDTTLKARISLSNSPKGISKDEFNTIKNAIQQHAATEWDIYVHDPNEPIFKDEN
jgi:hypothetical protein